MQALQTVDSERDSLQAELDTKAEAVVQLTEELDLAHQQTDEAHRGLAAAEGRLGRAEERVTAAEAETQGLRASLDSLRQHVQVGGVRTSKGWGCLRQLVTAAEASWVCGAGKSRLGTSLPEACRGRLTFAQPSLTPGNCSQACLQACTHIGHGAQANNLAASLQGFCKAFIQQQT